MARVLVRDLSSQTVARLKRHARAHGRSLQAELRTVLETAALRDMLEARVAAERIRNRLARNRHADSARSIAADRAR